MFLLVGSSFAFQYLLCFVHGQGHRTKEMEGKQCNKETGEAQDQSRLINYALTVQAQNEQSKVS